MTSDLKIISGIDESCANTHDSFPQVSIFNTIVPIRTWSTQQSLVLCTSVQLSFYYLKILRLILLEWSNRTLAKVYVRYCHFHNCFKHGRQLYYNVILAMQFFFFIINLKYIYKKMQCLQLNYLLFLSVQIKVGDNIKSQIVDLANIINNKTIPSLISVNSWYIFNDHILVDNIAKMLPCDKTLSFV
jgi:hypothetical protein